MKKFFSIFLSLYFLYCFVFVEIITAAILPLNADYLNLTTGKINDSFFTNSQNPQVIFIQDLHTSSSVQKNISEIIKEISNHYSVDKVLVEGIPYKKMDTSFIKNLSQFNITDNLLKNGLLSGVEYYLLTDNKNIEIYGLENWQQYLNNIKKASLILHNKTYTTKLYNKFKTDLYKKISNSKKLLKYVDFNLTDINLIKRMNQPILQLDTLQTYYRLMKNNNKLNIKQIKTEQKLLLNSLKTKLNFTQYNELINLSIQKNFNKYNKSLYFYLSNNKDLQDKYNNLYKYLSNTTKIQELSPISLIEQKNKYFESFLNDKFLNKQTKQKLFILKMTKLFESFLNLEITEQDYIFFKANYTKYLNLLPQYFPKTFNEYQSLFYTVNIFDYHNNNIQRNKTFIDNILNSLSNNSKTNIVIAGGFHTSILEELKKQNISYLLITPSVKNDKDNIVYNEIIESTFKKQALAKIPLILATMEDVPIETRFLYLTKVIETIAEDNYSVNNIENIISKLSIEDFPISYTYTNNKFTIYLDIDNKQVIEFDVSNGIVIMNNETERTNTEQIVITTDIHAGYSRWLQLFVYQLEPQLQNKEYSNLNELYNELIKIYPQYKTDNIKTESQFERAIENIIINILQQKDDTKFYILGDILDRGDKPVETFNFVKRIFETGKAEFVMGNHDIYAFMNLLGLHLPFYENYKGIPNDYIVNIAGKDINIQQLLKDKRNKKDKTVNSKIHWAKVLSEYMKYAQERQEQIWTPKEKDLQNLFTKTFSSEFTGDKNVDILHDPEGIFKQDDTLLNFHKKLFGRNVGTTVYTGIRAVDKMSINWWIEREEELTILSNRYPQYQQYWNELDELISNIISVQQEKINTEYTNGNWQWSVIDSIMYGNYKTTCWNALDWAYHAKWGAQDRGFIGYRNEQLRNENKKGIDNISYLEDYLFQEMLNFYQENFYLYKIDNNGICYMHSVLPIDEDSEIAIGYVDSEGNFHTNIKGFIYKGVHYEGLTLLEGFDVMTQDIRNYDISSNDLSQIYEALTIITSIYADNTTRVKPANVKEMKEVGFAEIFSKIGLGSVVVGHNPIEKLEKQNVNQIEYVTVNIFNFKVKIPILINSDRSMSKGYKNQGLARTVGNNAIETLYFEDGNTYNVSKTQDINSESFYINKLYNKLFVPLLNMANTVENTQKINKNNSIIITPLSIDEEECNSTKDIKDIEHLDKLHTHSINSVGLVISNKHINEDLVETSTLLDKTTIKTADTEIKLNIYLNKFNAANGTVDIIWIEYETGNITNENIENTIKQEFFNRFTKINTVYNFSDYKNVLLLDNNNLFLEVKPKDISSKMLETLFDTFGLIPPLVYTDKLNIFDNINKEYPSDIIIDMLSAA